MRRVTFFIVVSALAGLALALAAPGCGSKKPKHKTPADVDAGVDAGDEEQVAADTGGGGEDTGGGGGGDTGGGGGQEDTGQEQDTGSEPPAKGPAVFPPAPANDFPNRQAKDYLLSVKKAQLLPTKGDGACWDDCEGQGAAAITAATSKISALPPTSQGAFDTAGKALQFAVNAVGGAGAFPDVFVHIRCGNGQGHMTNKAGSKDKIIATWSYENKTVSLDERDECVITVWDADDDGDELMGQVTVPLVQRAKANGGKAVIFGAEDGFGSVYSLEIGLSPKDQAGGGAGGGTGGGTASGGGAGGKPPVEVPKAQYTVQVVKAKIKGTNRDGKPWDEEAKPSGKGGLLDMAKSAAGALGGKDPDVYVEAWFNGYLSQAPFVTTSVKKESYEPVWNEGGGITLKDTDFINFMVWDKDLANPDLIGECKTKPLGVQGLGEIRIENCGQVEYIIVKITKN